LAVVHVEPALLRRPAGRRLGALDRARDQVEQGGAVRSRPLTRRGVGEDLEELVLAERGQIATEEGVRRPTGLLGLGLAVDGGGEQPRQLALAGSLLGRGRQKTLDLCT